jgi:hypothetical protein
MVPLQCYKASIPEQACKTRSTNGCGISLCTRVKDADKDDYKNLR